MYISGKGSETYKTSAAAALPDHKNSHEKWQPLTLGNFFTVSIFLFPYIAKKTDLKEHYKSNFFFKKCM